MHEDLVVPTRMDIHFDLNLVGKDIIHPFGEIENGRMVEWSSLVLIFSCRF